MRQVRRIRYLATEGRRRSGSEVAGHYRLELSPSKPERAANYPQNQKSLGLDRNPSNGKRRLRTERSSRSLTPDPLMQLQKQKGCEAALERYFFQHFRGSFAPNGQDDIAESFGIEARFAIGKIILNVGSAIDRGTRGDLKTYLPFPSEKLDVLICHSVMLFQQGRPYSTIEALLKLLPPDSQSLRIMAADV